MKPWILNWAMAVCLFSQPPAESCSANASCQRWWSVEDGLRHELKLRVELLPDTPQNRRHDGHLRVSVTYRYRHSRETNHHRIMTALTIPEGQSFKEFTVDTLCSSLPHYIVDVATDWVDCH